MANVRRRSVPDTLWIPVATGTDPVANSTCRHLPPHPMETPTRPELPWCYGDGAVGTSSRRGGVNDISRTSSLIYLTGRRGVC